MIPVFTFVFFLEFLAEHMALPGECGHEARSGPRDVRASVVGALHFPLDGESHWSSSAQRGHGRWWILSNTWFKTKTPLPPITESVVCSPTVQLSLSLETALPKVMPPPWGDQWGSASNDGWDDKPSSRPPWRQLGRPPQLQCSCEAGWVLRCGYITLAQSCFHPPFHEGLSQEHPPAKTPFCKSPPPSPLPEQCSSGRQLSYTVTGAACGRQ